MADHLPHPRDPTEPLVAAPHDSKDDIDPRSVQAMPPFPATVSRAALRSFWELRAPCSERLAIREQDYRRHVPGSVMGATANWHRSHFLELPECIRGEVQVFTTLLSRANRACSPWSAMAATATPNAPYRLKERE